MREEDELGFLRPSCVLPTFHTLSATLVMGGFE